MLTVSTPLACWHKSNYHRMTLNTMPCLHARKELLICMPAMSAVTLVRIAWNTVSDGRGRCITRAFGWHLSALCDVRNKLWSKRRLTEYFFHLNQRSLCSQFQNCSTIMDWCCTWYGKMTFPIEIETVEKLALCCFNNEQETPEINQLLLMCNILHIIVSFYWKTVITSTTL